MPIYDSSLTRVQPVFRQLYQRDHTGASWLRTLLKLGSRVQQHEVELPAQEHWPGNLVAAPQFEVTVPSPVDYLKRLVCMPERLQAAGAMVNWGEMQAAVQQMRCLLMQGHVPTQQLALQHLQQQGVPGHGTWWVLEGITHVDCRLMSQEVTVFVEGKRTEPHLTGGVRWDLQRHQVFRNLDCLRWAVPEGAEFFVLLVVEADTPASFEASNLDGDVAAAHDSWPHLEAEAAAALRRRYLGYTTWQKIATTFSEPHPLILPHTVADAQADNLVGPL